MADRAGLKSPEHIGEADLAREIDQALLSHYAPASIVVTRQLRVVDRRGNLAAYVRPPRFAKVPAGEIGDAIRRCVQAASQDNSVSREELPGIARLTVMPIAAAASRKRLFVVIFDTPAESAADRVHDLEAQLAAARNYLAMAVEDYESTTEELQSAYEELKCANEELQQLNDELTSANENLGRLNAALESQSRDSQRTNQELVSLLNSVAIPMLMLDHDLRIRRFNPQAERFFNLQAADVGKPIREVRPWVALPHLEEACLDVLDTFAPRSRQVQDGRGRIFSLVMRPYRTEENRVDGVVLALIEKTSIATSNA